MPRIEYGELFDCAWRRIQPKANKNMEANFLILLMHERYIIYFERYVVVRGRITLILKNSPVKCCRIQRYRHAQDQRILVNERILNDGFNVGGHIIGIECILTVN